MLEEADFQLKENSAKLVEMVRTQDAAITDALPKLNASISAEQADLRLLRYSSGDSLHYADPEWLNPPPLEPKSLGNYRTFTHNETSWRVMARSWENGHELMMAIDLQGDY